MATQQTASAARLLVAPSVILLLLWMIVPLAMTLYFSTLYFNLLDSDNIRFVGIQNYTDFLSDPAFTGALINTLVLVFWSLIISVVGGAAAGGVVAVVLANIVAFFLVRMIGKNLEA